MLLHESYQIDSFGILAYVSVTTVLAFQRFIFCGTRFRLWHRTNFGTLCVQTDSFGTCRWLVPIQETRFTAWYFADAHTTAQTSARLACSFLYPFQLLRKRKLKRCGTHFIRANSRNSAQSLVFRWRSYHCTNFSTPCVLVFISASTFAQTQVERCGTHFIRANSRNSDMAWYFADAHTTAQTSARLACSFLYPFQRLRKRKLNGYKKLSAHYVCTQWSLWSE